MENTISPQPALHLEEAAVAALKIAAKWAKFIAIVSFVLIGLFVLVGVAAIAGSSFTNAFYGYGFESALAIAIYYFATAIISFIPTLRLFQFATKAKKAILDMQHSELTQSFLYLKSYFHFIGVLILIVIILCVVGVIGFIIGLSLQG
ncbi:DUF5362 family protein [Thermoflavifilum thermophilum]|uniref:Uncharacterized protein n=1 Tax=Thermoflavifilum thermophilum TaxID=1393122 RepID=A0A1I7N789_9BACT|nr:hypothetical protein [Thermoflavifilum thermophilum]SFV30511.1 hypothetical protein SAMN05660895_0813 [Thermoflavifilum thermophilum]